MKYTGWICAVICMLITFLNWMQSTCSHNASFQVWLIVFVFKIRSGFSSFANGTHHIQQVTEEKLKKLWISVDAQTNKREDLKRETVYCLDDDNETEVQKDDTIQGRKIVCVITPQHPVKSHWHRLSFKLTSFLYTGFRYGSDIVPFSKVDQEQMKYTHDGKCFAVLGFTKQSLVLYFLWWRDWTWQKLFR